MSDIKPQKKLKEKLRKLVKNNNDVKTVYNIILRLCD